MTTGGDVKAAPFRTMDEKVDGMPTAGTLFVFSLGMSLKEELTLQRSFKLHVLKFAICVRRFDGASSQRQT